MTDRFGEFGDAFFVEEAPWLSGVWVDLADRCPPLYRGSDGCPFGDQGAESAT